MNLMMTMTDFEYKLVENFHLRRFQFELNFFALLFSYCNGSLTSVLALQKQVEFPLENPFSPLRLLSVVFFDGSPGFHRIGQIKIVLKGLSA